MKKIILTSFLILSIVLNSLAQKGVDILEYTTFNVQYPMVAIEKNIQGTVVVRFDIDSNASIQNIEIIESAHELLNKSSINLINSIPKNLLEKNINAQLSIPINYKIDEGNSNELDATYYFNEGAKFYGNNKLNKAISMFKLALNENPNHSDALYNLAVILVKENNIEEACKYINKLVAINDPDGPSLQEKFCK